jgi:hypothetical protein
VTGTLILPDGRAVPVRDGLVIGRMPPDGLQLHDAKASRQHAAIRVTGSVVELEDLKSHNGTVLNGNVVQRRVLRDGDVIRIGTTELRYREAAAAAPPASPAADELTFDADPLHAGPAPRRAEPVRPAPRPPPPPAPPAKPTKPASEVLEFVDEVVQVRTEPRAPSGAAGGVEVTARHGRVLQFNKKADRKGILAEDLGQIGGLGRVLRVVAVLAFALGLGYLAMRLARGW